MQISKKRELSRKSGLKEYCGDEYCQNLKFSLGRVCGRRAGDHGRRQGDTGMKCPGGNSCEYVRVCVCWGKGVVTVGDKGLSAAREPTRGRMASGMSTVPGQHEV